MVSKAAMVSDADWRKELGDKLDKERRERYEAELKRRKQERAGRS